MTDVAPMTEERAAADRAACPFHMITEGHPTDMELAAKCGVDVSDAQIEAWAKTLTMYDLYLLYRRTTLESNKPKHFARWHRISHAWSKKNK